MRFYVCQISWGSTHSVAATRIEGLGTETGEQFGRLVWKMRAFAGTRRLSDWVGAHVHCDLCERPSECDDEAYDKADRGRISSQVASIMITIPSRVGKLRCTRLRAGYNRITSRVYESDVMRIGPQRPPSLMLEPLPEANQQSDQAQDGAQLPPSADDKGHQRALSQCTIPSAVVLHV